MGNTFTSGAASSGSVLSAAADPRRITVVPESHLRQLEQSSPASGLPRYAAIRPKRSTGQGVQRWEVLFYPTPNTAQTLSYRYSVAPDPISEAAPFPLGGKQHAETILQSCLAVAEKREAKQSGPAMEQFLSRLSASVQLDLQSAQPTDDGMWPLENPPDDLSIDLDYLLRLVGRHMGYGAHEGAWSHKQLNEVHEAIRAGLRRFYTPPVLPGERYAHEWSFLRPLATLNVADGVYEYDLPADLAMIDGPVTYEGTSVPYYEIQEMSEVQAGRRFNRTYKARPQVFAVRVKPAQDGEGTRWQMILWPTPDDSYTLNYRYKTNPGLLSLGVSEPAGGMPHAQAVIESCLLSADELLGREDRTRYARYMERLKASVSHDRLASTPDTFGRNRDNSDRYAIDGSTEGFPNWHYDSIHTVTYNGVSY